MNKIAARFSAYKAAVAAAMVLALAAPTAHAQGLARATSFLETIRDQLVVWIPIVAVIAGLILVVAYWFNMIQKDTFFKWLIGLIIAGSILEIVALFV